MKLEAASSETIDAKVLALAREDAIWLAVKAYFPDDPEGPAQGVNLVEFLADDEAALAAKLARVEAELASGMSGSGRRGYTVARGEAAASAIWSMRKKSVGLLGNMQGERRPVPFVEDTVVPPERLADYIAEFRAAARPARPRLRHVRARRCRLPACAAGARHEGPGPGNDSSARSPTRSSRSRASTRACSGASTARACGPNTRPSSSARSTRACRRSRRRSTRTTSSTRARSPRRRDTSCFASTACRRAGRPTGAFRWRSAAPTRTRCIATATPRASTTTRTTRCARRGRRTRERRHSPKGRASLMREWLRLLAEADVDPSHESARLRQRSAWSDLDSTFPGAR